MSRARGNGSLSGVLAIVVFALFVLAFAMSAESAHDECVRACPDGDYVWVRGVFGPTCLCRGGGR